MVHSCRFLPNPTKPRSQPTDIISIPVKIFQPLTGLGYVHERFKSKLYRFIKHSRKGLGRRACVKCCNMIYCGKRVKLDGFGGASLSEASGFTE